jgi:hypothetical protein
MVVVSLDLFSLRALRDGFDINPGGRYTGGIFDGSASL